MTEPKQVDPSTIEEELKSIWTELEGEGKMRACLYTLIVYTKASERAQYLKEIVKKTIDKFPSRILFFTLGQSQPLITTVSVMSSGKIACDLIDISLDNNARDQVPFYVLPHLIPDLPIYLLWADALLENDPVRLQLEEWVTRIIFDSENTTHLSQFAEAALTHTSSDIADLNWARIEGWRVLLCSLLKNGLANIDRIHLTYNSHTTPYFTHTRIQALYLQAWLASCLNWQWSSYEDKTRSISLFYHHNGRPISVELEPIDLKEVAPGRIATVEINTAQKDHLLLQRNPELPHQIIIQKSTAKLCALPNSYMFAKYESGQSLINEICHKGTSSHYKKVLQLLAQSGVPA